MRQTPFSIQANVEEHWASQQAFCLGAKLAPHPPSRPENDFKLRITLTTSFSPSAYMGSPFPMTGICFAIFLVSKPGNCSYRFPSMTRHSFGNGFPSYIQRKEWTRILSIELGGSKSQRPSSCSEQDTKHKQPFSNGSSQCA